uniref:GIY-YIG nuclease family protein n=1 Tax=Ditylenchus dipsaci TaxID=166011 RepID=A0A915EJI0_9BILA
MTKSTSAMTSAADRPQEFSIDEPEENEKKPFYKSTLFIVIAAIILLALLLGIVLKMEKFIHVYQGKPWHPEIQSILNARLVESSTLDSASDSESSASGASERFENLFPGKPASYGTGYVIVSVPDQKDSKAAIIYAGISGDSAKSESQASHQWSSRMILHAKSHLFQKYKEIRFYKVLERASIEAIRYWEFSTVYAKNLIDSTVTQYPLDRPHNDEYYLELRNIEYPSHYLTIETITPQQAEEWMAKAYAEILSALKKILLL